MAKSVWPLGLIGNWGSQDIFTNMEMDQQVGITQNAEGDHRFHIVLISRLRGALRGIVPEKKWALIR